MHAARLENSARLQRVMELLEKGGEYSTRDIIRGADVCAVSAIISELRNPINGVPIAKRTKSEGGRTIHLYRLAPGQRELDL